MRKSIFIFTFLCTNILNAMEVEHNGYVGMSMQDLPREIQSLIIEHLNTGDTVKNVIRTIIRMSRTNKAFNTTIKDIYDNQKGFTPLIHKLANNFHTNPSHIAQQFKTTIAEKYIRLGTALLTIIQSNNTQSVKEIIETDADINYYNEMNLTPLIYTVLYGNADIINVLLEHGAKPTFTKDEGKKILEKNKKKERIELLDLIFPEK